MDVATWLQSLEQRGIKPGLERIQAVIDPAEITYPVVQVAGTNGKGSVCYLLDGVLQQHGLTVGRYTSPHLHRVNERIAINNVPISDKKLYDLAEPLMQQDVGLSYFEALTTIALRYFKPKVDIAILEAGMGGRFDATSVLDPQIAIITTIALEHEQYLGNTMEAIASEKAGIIKAGSTVVTACTYPSLAVIEARATEMTAPVYAVGREVTWEYRGPGSFIIVHGTETYDITTRLTGVFQGQNIAIAVTAAELLGISRSIIEAGVRNVTIPGRMERRGRFLLDGAHNPAGMQALRTSLHKIPHRQLVIVLAIMQDKNIEDIINELPAGEVIVTRANIPRAASMEVIGEQLAAAGRTYHAADTVPDALNKAYGMSQDGDCIVVTGSLYLVGEARALLCSSTEWSAPQP